MGGKIVYARAGALWMLANGRAQQLTDGPRDENDKRDMYPAISPDGTEIAYTRMDEGFSGRGEADGGRDAGGELKCAKRNQWQPLLAFLLCLV